MENIKFKETPKYNKEVIDEILLVKEQSGLTAKNLVERARNKNSPLHNLFDWDNESAGDKYRVQQAIWIINDIKFYVEDKELYAFENVSFNVIEENSEVEKREYLSLPEILSKEELREKMIRRALNEAEYWNNRYHDLKELSPIFNAIESTKKKWQKKK